MLTKNEISSLNLSPTKKDFVQIWNELLEVASKLSERWDPTSTNESDPGIVILKALVGIADKLNYNIDKNTLEAFMPTAAQEDSMRKLCDMLGYNIKYYQSAVTDVTIKYHNTEQTEAEKELLDSNNLYLPKFTVITNGDKDINYFTINDRPLLISTDKPYVTVSCMEGQLVKCDSTTDNSVITIHNISENNRFYLPETQIAENGIFIYNAVVNSGTALTDGEKWEKTDNLNIQPHGSKKFKFGYDSYESRPYVEFPEDYSELFGEGIFLYYTRTSGVNGNVSARTLTQIELPASDGWKELSAESFSVENAAAATSGSNIETIKQAYDNFKKTIGTFETLVTCKDYMNKIYRLTSNTGKPIVSNILVSDIRNDLNRAVTICSCDDAGIFYKETPLQTSIKKQTTIIVPIDTTITSEVEITANRPVFDAATAKWYIGAIGAVSLTKKLVEDSAEFITSNEGDVRISDDGYYTIAQGEGTEVREFKTKLRAKETVTIPVNTSVQETIETTEETPAINHFDLVFYPFKSFNQSSNSIDTVKVAYDNSFTYSTDQLTTITQALEADSVKTLAHNIISPRKGDIVCINNYFRLNATIATNTKITEVESNFVIENIKTALANAFNMRELDFGEEIPFDSILEVIEQADPRIRVASLNEPALYTTYSVITDITDGTPTVTEYAVASDWLSLKDAEATGRLETTPDDSTYPVSTFDTAEAKAIYNKLAVRNVLAGRVPLFNYNNTFKASFSEGAYQVTDEITPDDNGEIILPDDLVRPDDANPFTVQVINDITYTGILTEAGAKYYKTYTPAKFKDNVITTAPVGEEACDITDIKAECIISSDKDNDGLYTGIISDVTLAANEFVRFRAPNFVTTHTYPAYVNYHLDLKNAIMAQERAADAKSLFECLDSDRDTWSTTNTDIKWQKVLDYFGNIGGDYKKKFTVKQKVSTFSTETGAKAHTLGDTIVLGISTENTKPEEAETTVEAYMAKSGCVKLTNKNFKADVAWLADDNGVTPAGTPNVELVLSDFTNPFITSVNVIASVKEAIDTALATYRNELPEKAFEISLSFECVPFEAKSLNAWATFIKQEKANILDFEPIADQNNGSIFWRIYGEGYEIGEYITESTEKLLNFTSSYFGLLPQDNYLRGIYLIKDIGLDAHPAIISNDEEYELKRDEYLYIEYTPSSTTEDGSSQDLPAVTEIYTEGTIVKPSGFELGGLMDSEVLATTGATPHKTVTFTNASGTSKKVAMHRFGVNEQLAIRDYARVLLNRETFKKDTVIYLYKNFNDVDELEKIVYDESGKRASYTLKDGEYVFYTDQNKSELAYFTSGTEVSLSGDLVLGQYDIIDLSTIFESGVQAVPWKAVSISDSNGICFQEYQYITLGKEDTIKQLKLLNGEAIDSTWRFCQADSADGSSVEYTVAGDDTKEPKPLPAINIAGRDGNGWEVCSTLTIDSSQSYSQALRKTEKVLNKVTLYGKSKYGSGMSNPDKNEPIELVPETSGSTSMLLKTNLTCAGTGNYANVDKVLLNPDKLKGFQVKVFVDSPPVIVRTAKSAAVPYAEDNVTNIIEWPDYGEKLQAKTATDPWTHITLDQINVGMTNKDAVTHTEYDNALLLSASLLPNTYGVFCVYIQYSNKADELQNEATWIELLPGVDKGTVELLNADSEYSNNRLMLNPGINCIRVNSTGRILIKSSNTAKGILCFDELKLVDTEAIAKFNTTTYGLNLAQIGYLANTDDKDYLYTSAIRDLKLAALNNAYAGVEQAVEEGSNVLLANYNALAAVLHKVKTLVDAETAINKDLATLSANPNRHKDLVEHLTDIEQRLADEKALLSHCSTNEGDYALDHSLVSLFEGASTSDTLKQTILKALADIRAEALIELEALSDDDIITSFLETKYKDTSANIAIKNAAKAHVESLYSAKVVELATALNNAINSDAGNKILELLQPENQDTLIVSVLTLLSKLSRESDSSEIDAIMTSMMDAASTANYTELLTLLTGLRNTVERAEIPELIEELVTEVSNGEFDKADSVLSNLEDIISSIGVGTDDVSLAIDDLYNTVSAELGLDTHTNVQGIVNQVSTLAESISDLYKIQLGTIIDSIQDLLSSHKDTADNQYSALVAVLTASKDAKVGTLIAQINTAIQEHSTNVASVDGLFTTSNSLTGNEWLNDKELSEVVMEAIIAVWPAYLKTKLYSAFNDINTVFTNAIKVATDELPDPPALTIAGYKAELAALVSKVTSVADKAAITALFEQVVELESVFSQETANKKFINDICKLIPELPTVDVKNGVISTLVADVKNASTVVERHNKVKQLEAALADAIYTDEQLILAITNLICPNTIKVMASIDTSDEFFTKLVEEVLGNNDTGKTGIKRAILQLNETQEVHVPGNLPNDNSYEKLISVSFEKFKGKIADFALPEITLMPDKYTALVKTLKDTYKEFPTDGIITDVKNKIIAVIKKYSDAMAREDTTSDSKITEYEDFAALVAYEDIKVLTAVISELQLTISDLEDTDYVIDDADKALWDIRKCEEQLLSYIKTIDTGRSFYYNVSIENHLAIEFDENSDELNTLMNPAINFDVNNVNNSFVISKLDIDYLTKGIKIARASKLS